MSAAPAITPDAARELVAAWERQQEVYVPLREARFTLMTDVLAHVCGESPRVLDLGCGPGSASARVLRRFPGAEVVAVDLDPVLLELARLSLGDGARSPQWVRADLTDPGWPELLPAPVAERAAEAPFDAVVSTTALHWLSGAELAELYRQVRGLLRPGGVLLNGDHLPPSRPHGRLWGLATELGTARERAAVATGAQDWQGWWERVRAVPALAQQVAARDTVLADRVRHPEPSRATHVEALREAGFDEVDVLWQDLSEGLLCAMLAP